MVAATEEHDPRLATLDSTIKQIDADMKEIWASVGWEFEAVKQNFDYDSTRHSLRRGTTLGLDGKPRRAFNLFGDYDRDERDFILRLKRSFLGPDHEVYVKISGRRLEKMDAVIRKQEIRRDIHLATLQAVLEVLYRQTILPLVEEQIALAQREVQLLSAFQKAGEALQKDLLAAQRQLHAFEEQKLIDRHSIRISLNDLRQKTGLPSLALPTTVPLVADSLAPLDNLNEEEATSLALTGRLEYVVAEMRVRQAERMADYMSWYWPRVDFEVAWNKYKDTRRFLDDFRQEKGRIFSTELSVNIPLNLPYRGWLRRESFRATQQRYQNEMEQIRRTIENQTLRSLLDLQQARLHDSVARDDLTHAREEARATELLAERLPEEIQGIAEVGRLEALRKVLDARIALCTAEHQLLLAQARWDYQVGNSPIDEAVTPYENLDLRAAEKKGWLRWWTSLMK